MSDKPPQQDLRDQLTGALSSQLGPIKTLLKSNRGQAEQIGFILIIVAVLSLFTLAQVQFAPQVRNTAEIEHGSQVISDYQDIHGDTLTASLSGQRGSSVLQMGSSYPTYLILAHPPDPGGTLRTSDSKSLEISNAKAVNDETAEFVDGDTQSFEHHSLRYSPRYNEFESAGDTVIEQGTLYQDFDSNVEILGTPNIVEGNRITLTANTGDISLGTTTSRLVETTALSASQETVIVEDDGDPIKIEFESDLSASKWEQILEPEIDEGGSSLNDRYITDVSDGGGNTVVLTLQEDETYELNKAKLGYKLGEQAAFAASEDPDVKYLTTDQATETTVQAGGTLEFTVQTHDKFSNSVSNVVVDGTAVEGSVTAVSRVTRSDGTATFIYEAPESSVLSGDVNDQVEIFIDSSSLPTDQSTVTFEVTVQDT
jgi:hypothetical protein